MTQNNQETEVYEPFLKDETLSNSTELEAEYNGRLRRQLGGRPMSIIAVIFIIYSVTLVLATLAISSAWWKKRMLHGAGVVETPLRESIHYEPTIFQRGWKDNYTLMGTPSPTLDDAWNDILQYYYSEVPYEFMESLGRLREGIQLDNGNYIATYGVMHHVHCLKRIHHAFYPDYYYTDWTEQEIRSECKHTFHCLQSLLEVTMCKADESPLTMRWLDDEPKPNGNPHIAHECVDWGLLMQEFARTRVDPGVFVHPKLGKSWPEVL